MTLQKDGPSARKKREGEKQFFKCIIKAVFLVFTFFHVIFLEYGGCLQMDIDCGGNFFLIQCCIEIKMLQCN